MATNPKAGRKLLKKDSKIVREIEKKTTPNKSLRKAKDKAFTEKHSKELTKTKQGKEKKGYGNAFGGRGSGLK